MQADFAAQDRDGNGQLSREEWRRFLAFALGPDVAAQEAEMLFTQADRDNNGQLSLQEVAEWHSHHVCFSRPFV